MQDAEIYQRSNLLQRRDAIMFLEKHASKFSWKKSNNRIIDIGSGDGGVTIMLRKFLPDDYTLLGCDCNENMKNYASDHYCNERTSFAVLDITNDLPEEMKGNFDKVFSFYALNWILDQERVFTNIFNLMDKRGECFLIIMSYNPLFEVYRFASRDSKWSAWHQDVENYISPYHDLQNPAQKIRGIMENVGFVNIDIECNDLTFLYDDINIMKKALKAVNPFKVPEEKYDEYSDYTMKVLNQILLKDKFDANCSPKNIALRYKTLVVYGQKQ